MRILGIDPGLRNMGWGIIDSVGSRLSHVANGICHSSGQDLAQRLHSLHEQLTDVLHRYQPDQAAIEQTFVNKDAVATLKLGQARGIALLVPAQAGLEIGEYAPNKVKKTVVGVGSQFCRPVPPCLLVDCGHSAVLRLFIQPHIRPHPARIAQGASDMGRPSSLRLHNRGGEEYILPR